MWSLYNSAESVVLSIILSIQYMYTVSNMDNICILCIYCYCI